MNAVLDEVQGIPGPMVTLEIPTAIRRRDEEGTGMFRERTERIMCPVRPTVNWPRDDLSRGFEA